jgi:tetratricopeptide (TPR) repeat protein
LAGYKLEISMSRRVRTTLLLALGALAAFHAPAAEAQTRKKKPPAAAAVPAAPPPAGTAPSGPDGLGPARDLLRSGKYKEAEKAAADVAKSDASQKAAAAVVRARALEASGGIDRAIEVLREVESDPVARGARTLLGEYLIATGKRREARAPLMTLVQDYNDDAIKESDAEGLTLVGRAAHLLRSPRDANDAYNAAEKAGGNKRVETLLDRADLFLDKYDPGHAAEVVSEAAKIAPEEPTVRIAIARVKLESAMDFDAAEVELKKALEVNPNLAEAHFVRAGLALRDLDVEAADKALDQGLAVNPKNLELLSMRAAARFLADDKKGFEAVKKKVLELNPEYSRFFQIVSEYAEWEHRYDDIVAFMREATTLDPRDEKAWAQLGLNLIRAGDDKGGVEALKKAWELDKFNVRVYNTLNLFERDVATQYVTTGGQTFHIRYHKEEKAVLERLVPKMLEEAWADMVKRYGFKPTTPISIELYGDPEHFSVRTSGLPNVGIQGVCFGKSLAMLSPRAAGFNWGNVLWHELAHVFAIQQSKSHVPRWFTEGLSEYETIVRRPEWRREEDPALYAALRSGRLPTIERFNRAFTHVDTIEEVTTAYYAASQLLVFLVERHGMPKVVSMLNLWGEGKRTRDVVQQALGAPPEEIDKQFRGWLEKKLAGYARQYVPDLHAPPLEAAQDAAKAAPRDAHKQVEVAVAMLRARDEKGARAAIDAALAIDPKQPDAKYLKLRLAMGEEDAAAASALVAELVKDGHDGYAVRMRAADLAEGKKDLVAMRRELEAAHRFDTTQAEPLQALYDMARKRGDAVAKMDALAPLARIDQHDRRVWGQLLDGQVARFEWAEALPIAQGIAFVDPQNSEAHRLRARTFARAGLHLSAIEAYNTALIAGPRPEKAREIYVELEKGYKKVGHPELAAKARAMADRVKVPPPSPGAAQPGSKTRTPPPSDDEE